MIFKKSVIVFIGLVIVTATGHILLYSTESNVTTEAIICTYYVADQTIEFCHRLGTTFHYASYSTECQNRGKKWTYKELLKYNITPLASALVEFER